MFLSAILATVAFQAASPDPLSLSIGSPGQVQVELGRLTSTANGRVATPLDVAIAARYTKFVYIGESHDNPLHHQMQADVIRALAADGREVVVGMEMFTRPNQKSLAPWTMGWWTEDQFIAGSDWKKQWGFDYALYRPIFEAAKELKLPILALNAPRDWVRSVGRGGFASLTPEQRAQLPDPLGRENKDHKAVFGALMGGHPMTGPQADNMYSAQVLWDEAMADTAIKYLKTRTAPNVVVAVVAGSGHVMYGQGINYRVALRTGDKGITVTMSEAETARSVSRGLGDFVFLTAPTKSVPKG